jgi:hypothetical protein
MLVTLDQLPPSVAGLRVRDRGNGSSLVVQWDSVFAADLYRYRVSVGTAPGVYDTSYLQTTRSRLLTGLTAGTTYYVGVSIVDLAGLEGIIVEQSGIPRTVPLPPVGLVAESIPNAIRLYWQRNQEIDLRGYNLYQKADTATTFSLVNGQPIVDTFWVDGVLPPGVYSYYVTALDSSANESGASDTVSGSPIVGVGGFAEQVYEFKLYPNFPNPFNPSTELSYEIGSTSHVRLVVFDVLGREVARLVNQIQSPGAYTVRWDAARHASGTYFCVLGSGSYVQTRRMMLIR